MANSSAATNMATSSTTTALVDITGSTTAGDTADSVATTTIDMGDLLSGQQLDALLHIKVGDLLFVVKGVLEALKEDMSDSEVGEDEDEDSEGEDDDNVAEDEQDAMSSVDEGDDEENEDASAANEHDDEKGADVPRQSDFEATTAPVGVFVPPGMFIVTAIECDQDDMITDIKVQRMTYSRVIDKKKPHIYHIYGDEIVNNHSIDQCNACEDTVSITTILSDLTYLPIQSPEGDYVRRMDQSIASNSRHQCISGCRDGWLTDRQLVNSLIADHYSPVLAWGGDLNDVPLEAPVCPVCVGREHFKEQEKLQGILLTTGRVSIDEVISHQGELNARRTALGYPFRQFDERLWGMYFDDMDGEDGEGEMDGGWDDPYEHFPEALDPNAYIKLNPASEAAIQALPRRLFGEAGIDAAKCGVCMEQLKEDSVVIELPCGHAEHHAECLELWLRQQDTCTMCRTVVPAAEVVIDAAVVSAPKEEMEEEEPREEGEAVTPEEEDVGDLPPGFLHADKGAAMTDSNVAELLNSSSWVTEEGVDIMSD